MIKSKRVSGKSAIGYRNYRRARERALSKLAQSYPETYKELLEQEKVNDETTGAKWLAIDGDTTVAVAIRADDRVQDISGGSDGHHSEDEGDEGGEA